MLLKSYEFLQKSFLLFVYHKKMSNYRLRKNLEYYIIGLTHHKLTQS